MTEEPTVLDYVKSRLKFWEASVLNLPRAGPKPGAAPQVEPDLIFSDAMDEGIPLEVIASTAPQLTALPARPVFSFPWRTLVAFGLALLAQLSLEPHREWFLGAILYAFAFLGLLLANLHGEWRPVLAEETGSPQPLIVRPWALLAGIFYSVAAYATFGGGLFTRLNTTLWVLALASLSWAFWVPTPGASRRRWTRISDWLMHPHITLNSWALLLIGVALLAVYFRADLINQIPSQMNSDHAEKLLDTWDVLQGQTRIFFPRNTGREALQIHLIAATAKIFHTGISFLSMKLGTIVIGLLTLPFIYLIGKEIGNRWVGLLGMAFAGIAYWPNVITRLALRFTFYPFFAALTLYFLIRGLRRQSRNDLILSGLFLGLGLHSYTPVRILPIVVVVGVVLYLLHQRRWQMQKQAIFGLAVLALIAVVGFLPLLRYISTPAHREMFFYRSLTRAGTLEQPLPDAGWKIFLSNTWNAMCMFGWDNGDVWTVSVPYRPALDAVSGALFYLGMGLLFLRFLRKRNWVDLFLLLSVPLLMLPSILSLAFPNENPVLSRASGAIVPAFVMVGIALESLLSTLRQRMPAKGPYMPALVVGLGGLLFILAANANYDLVFQQYRKGYELSSWNSSEMGAVYKDFSTTIGTRDTFWLVGYPHWVDSRLISIVAGYPERDCAIFTDQLSDTLLEPRAKLFLLHPLDKASLSTLGQIYPQGTIQVYPSKYETKEFVMFFVPPAQ